MMQTDLERDLAALLNRYSQENGSSTPDFLLAEYLVSCLATWNTYVVKRDTWGRVQGIPGIPASGGESISLDAPEKYRG
jgi:hypothetical protein